MFNIFRCFKKSNIYVVLICCFFSKVSSAQNVEQKALLKEFTLTTDNDTYLPKRTDRYYTNGIRFKYSYALTHSNTPLKNTCSWEFGQMIFNAQRRRIDPYQVSEVDRPIAGYLYLKFLKTKFFDNNKALQYGVSAGVVGPASLAEKTQNYIHRQAGINSAYWGWVWQYQLKNEPGINMHGVYFFNLVKNKKSNFQATPVADVTLGTTFTNVITAMVLQLGKLNKLNESSFFDAALALKQQHEFFIFYKPSLTYQLYNATVEGGMFRHDKGPITSPVRPFMWVHETGIMFSNRRYSASVHYFQQSKEAKTQSSNHAYASIAIACRFR